MNRGMSNAKSMFQTVRDRTGLIRFA